ncbi:NupC/NupG family nucleoside CNT transporter [Virgibacillus halodenitrificans]|uniref:NupC/NupG family nucleoside CNT transporter n=1 Tax=Virgibacillus halodenitrificans TaxID=1482 RepID=A0AAC9IWP2_VIRHA|nr:nucleoside transporter C-terminal domain-containing protein [Virgibacillus halodenitrificans]APC47386.1 pyrimidine nucleoside transporter NupC [Virgibacillus halodenitrificans]MBD1221666.1 NupC/NupG family nucleoside CNT transporter [Virgibacillus halodenitrificans]MCG1029744.1 NupC/NupG family nucleoside CNT transporter [Virgibacillus halodenitrificans]MCJ0932331.1 NupC/NupG family nucleoside CNT transporter [Virgibacillus halodenitrificans]MEC2160652.1 nucleoside transporter C-terminal do
MAILLGIVAIIVVLGLAFLMSNDKRNINYKGIGIMLVLQLLTTWFMFTTEIGQFIINKISAGFNKLIEFGTEGVNFVVGGFVVEEGGVFFFNVLLLIIFFATILSVLTYLKILPPIIKYLGGLISKITGLPKVESFNAVNSIFFGQSEALIAIRTQFHHLNDNRLYIVSASAMGSVSASIVGAYLQMLPPEYVLVALPLNMFSALMVASIIAPVRVPKEKDIVDIKDVTNDKSIFEAMGNGALEGGKIALIVAAMLIAFIASLELVNWLIQLVFAGITLQEILGYILSPIGILMGISPGEVVQAGSVMGTKIVTNEFVAMLDFQPMIADMSEKTVGIVSVFLTSFANFSSIGIIAGTVKGIDSEKAVSVSGFGLKLLVGATLASILSATIVGLFL